MKLTQVEVNELIERYNSDLRKLKAQESYLRNIVKELRTEAKELAAKARTVAPATPAAPAAKAPAKRRGRPAKAKTATTTAKKTTAKRGRPAKKTTTAAKSTPAAKKTTAKKATAKKAAPKKAASAKGYRLSEWDNVVMNTLNDRKKVSVFSDFMEYAKANGSKLSDQDLYRRINQSLHKLANKRGDLIKVPRKGRGYGYALPAWKSGRGIAKEFQ
jgi:cell division septum initiation protein DivIVA